MNEMENIEPWNSIEDDKYLEKDPFLFTLFAKCSFFLMSSEGKISCEEFLMDQESKQTHSIII